MVPTNCAAMGFVTDRKYEKNMAKYTVQAVGKPPVSVTLDGERRSVEDICREAGISVGAQTVTDAGGRTLALGDTVPAGSSLMVAPNAAGGCA